MRQSKFMSEAVAGVTEVLALALSCASYVFALCAWTLEDLGELYSWLQKTYLTHQTVLSRQGF